MTHVGIQQDNRSLIHVFQTAPRDRLAQGMASARVDGSSTPHPYAKRSIE